MVAAVVTIAAHTALLHTAEISSYGEEVGSVLYELSLAYAAAWFFQWLVIELPASGQRDRLHRLVARRVDRLIECGLELATCIRVQDGQDPEFPIQSLEGARVCESTNSNAQPPGWKASWHEMLLDIVQSTGRHRASLEPFYARLDEQLLSLLEDEEDCSEVLPTI